MSKRINIGIITAYGFARLGGYTGTKEQFIAGLAASAQYATNAAQSAEDSEAWAKGTRGGSDVTYTDPTYHNSSKYWAEQSAHISTGIRLDGYSSLIPADRDGKTKAIEITIKVYGTRGTAPAAMTYISASAFTYKNEQQLPGAITPLVSMPTDDTEASIKYSIPDDVFPGDAGRFVFKFSIGGTKYTAVHAWALAKDGEKGDKGDTGEVTQAEFDELAAAVEEIGLYRDDDGDLCEVDGDE